MPKDYNRISFRLRDKEAAKLAALIHEFHQNYKPGPEDGEDNDARYFLSLSKYQLCHLLIAYAWSRKSKFIPLLVRMANERIPNLDSFERVYGDVSTFELSQQLDQESYVDVTANGPLTKRQYEKMIHEKYGSGPGRPRRRAED